MFAPTPMRPVYDGWARENMPTFQGHVSPHKKKERPSAPPPTTSSAAPTSAPVSAPAPAPASAPAPAPASAPAPAPSPAPAPEAPPSRSVDPYAQQPPIFGAAQLRAKRRLAELQKSPYPLPPFRPHVGAFDKKERVSSDRELFEVAQGGLWANTSTGPRLVGQKRRVNKRYIAEPQAKDKRLVDQYMARQQKLYSKRIPRDYMEDGEDNLIEPMGFYPRTY